MARSRKTPKPKRPTHERIDPTADPQKVYPLLKSLVKTHRSDLADAKIAIAWRYGWKKNKDGQLVLGKCKKAGDLDKQFHDQDFVIILNYEAWTTHLTPPQRTALMHHELEHAAISEDQNGNPKLDARGRQMYRVRKHDIEEFQSIIKTYGCYKSDIEEFVRAAVKSPKPPAPTLLDGIPFDAEAAAPKIEEELRAAGHDVTVIGKNGESKLDEEATESTPRHRLYEAEPSMNGHTHGPEPSANGHAHANGKPKRSNPVATKNRIKGKVSGKPRSKARKAKSGS